VNKKAHSQPKQTLKPPAHQRCFLMQLMLGTLSVECLVVLMELLEGEDGVGDGRFFC
jgi:hypothetical protein